uniref:helicase-related protein n=1 Tax=uncultured Thiodictyon sp. TaxID=1846217 RepID=UPI00260071F5
MTPESIRNPRRAKHISQELSAQPLDFLGDPEAVRVLVEGERLSYGHLFNPAFATEIAAIDPLPHQRIAVYDRMLPQARLRFLLADDAGAGKTIMTGLYVREALSRRTLRRVLVVAPAGLVGNWQRELRKLFQLSFMIVTGADARGSNPFLGADSDRLIVSIDSLRAPRLFGCLRDPAMVPYDLVVFDEAHKLSARRDPDGSLAFTDRYRLAEALAGVRDLPPDWRLPWSAAHLLLLTATPHMGKPYPYYALWRLLEPDIFSTETAFERFPPDARARYFIRRVKEEMVDLAGRPLFPVRVCDTVSFELTQGEVSEQALYDRTTAYIRHYYNLARLLNRQAARFAVMIFQRRLASSTWALLCSLRKRLAKLDGFIDAIRSDAIPEDEWRARQALLERQADKGKLCDLLETQTADEEASLAGQETHEANEDEALGSFLATNLGELLAERDEVQGLVRLAEAVHAAGHESKFERMRALLTANEYRGQKVIIYTEHRDTLDFLTRRLEGLGFAGQVVCIHGGMGYLERDAAVERFRADHEGPDPRQGETEARGDGHGARTTPDDESGGRLGRSPTPPSPIGGGRIGPRSRRDFQGNHSGEVAGARFLIGTDAAAEGINLQFCWILINYDVPWNPARLEQRMGRIHRYGQRRDRVAIINLVAGATREGRVIKTLLDKLEEIRKQLGSDKVFDVVGRLFEDLPLAEYIRRAVDSGDLADREALALAGRLTADQVRAIAEREASLDGRGGEVAAELPRLREAMAMEELRHLLPGYVRGYLTHAAPLLGLDLIAADRSKGIDGPFNLRPRRRTLLEPLLPLLETYPASARKRFTVSRPADERDAIFLHPGDPLFERLSALAIDQARPAGRRGAIFTDAAGTAPYLFHVARLSVLRAADPDSPSHQTEEVIEQRLVGLKQYQDRLEEAPVEQLLLLRPGRGTSPGSLVFLAEAETCRLAALDYLTQVTLGQLTERRRLAAAETLAQTKGLLGLAYDYQAWELTTARKEYAKQARAGNLKAQAEVERIRAQQAGLTQRRARAIADASRELDLITPGQVEIIATCLVQPSQDPADLLALDLEVERIAMQIAMAAEIARGATVRDVSTPERARLAGLMEYPGFDLLSERPGEERGIEVKGRVGTDAVELTANEWARACNLRGRYWLYAVFDCGTGRPRLLRVQDPFGRLVSRNQGGVLINYGDIV